LIEDEPDYVRVRCEELPVPVHIDHGMSAPPDARLWVAIRPEKVMLSSRQPEIADNWAHGVVKEIAYMGDLSIFLIELDGGRQIRVSQANSARKPEEVFGWDEAVYVSWDASSPVVGTG
jgi:putrescine transport system ATP-binding protein